MKPYRLFLNTILFVSLFISSTAWTQTRMNGLVTITTTATPDKVIAEGGNIYLSSVNISGSQISSGGLDLSTTTTAGTVTAKENADVGLASLLLNNSTVGGVPNAVELEAVVENVTANENSRIHASTISLQGTTISGDLTLNEKIYTRAGAITAGEGAEIGLASVLLDNTQLNSLRIDTLKAEIGDLTVQQGGQAYISTLKLSGVTGGDMGFSADTKIGGPLTVAEGELLNVNSVVMEGATVSGEMNFDLTTTVHGGIEVSGDGAEVMVGGVRLASINSPNPNTEADAWLGENQPIGHWWNTDGRVSKEEAAILLPYAQLAECVYKKKIKTCGDYEQIQYNSYITSGLRWGIYVDTKNKDLAFAFAGTKWFDLRDWLDNIYQAIGPGSASPQYDSLTNLGKKYDFNSLIDQGYSISITGHSLGGGLAKYFSAALAKKNKNVPISVYAFNGAALNEKAFIGKSTGELVKDVDTSKITVHNIRLKGDSAVSAPSINEGEKLFNKGRFVNYELPDRGIFKGEHSMKHIVSYLNDLRNGKDVYYEALDDHQKATLAYDRYGQSESDYRIHSIKKYGKDKEKRFQALEVSYERELSSTMDQLALNKNLGVILFNPIDSYFNRKIAGEQIERLENDLLWNEKLLNDLK